MKSKVAAWLFQIFIKKLEPRLVSLLRYVDFFLEPKFWVHILKFFAHAPGPKCPSGRDVGPKAKDPGFESHRDR